MGVGDLCILLLCLVYSCDEGQMNFNINFIFLVRDQRVKGGLNKQLLFVILHKLHIHTKQKLNFGMITTILKI